MAAAREEAAEAEAAEAAEADEAVRAEEDEEGEGSVRGGVDRYLLRCVAMDRLLGFHGQLLGAGDVVGEAVHAVGRRARRVRHQDAVSARGRAPYHGGDQRRLGARHGRRC